MTDETEIDLPALWDTLRRQRWRIARVVLVCAVLSAIYAFLAPQWYRAEVLMVPAATKQSDSLSGQLGGLSGLASLAGINIGSNSSSEPLAVLKSREFAQAFIEQQRLMPILFAENWHAKVLDWLGLSSAKHRDIRDGVKYFIENVRSVQEDKKTGLITLAVEWRDPSLAAQWANQMADQVNDSMRSRALVEAQANVDYLREQLGAAGIVTLQQSVGRLLDSELQKVMMARGKKEYAFRVIDHAQVPKWRARPMRAQIVTMATLVALMLAVLYYSFRDATFGPNSKSGAGGASRRKPAQS